MFVLWKKSIRSTFDLVYEKNKQEVTKVIFLVKSRKFYQIYLVALSLHFPEIIRNYIFQYTNKIKSYRMRASF